jgi:hypothetical protein
MKAGQRRGPAKTTKSKQSIDIKWRQVPLATLPPEPESGPPDWLVRCGPRPAWLVLGAMVRFPELGAVMVAAIRPGAKTWEAMPSTTSRWVEIEALEPVAPPAEGYHPWPGTSINLKLGG